MNLNPDVLVLGGGLAGCEAAWQLAKRGISVELVEMRPHETTPAHEGSNLAELVCSNSFKAENVETGSGMLKREMRMLDSLVLKVAEKVSVPAGNSLAVDRDAFSKEITKQIESHELITLKRGEITEIPEKRPLIIATGPLTSDDLAVKIKNLFGGGLHFYDAIAPVVDADSINMDICFFKSRYDKGEADYLNCPMTTDQYNDFYNALMEAEKVPLHDFEEKVAVFEGCMPLEEMASRGIQTLTFGPLKPVGLEHPLTHEKYYAVLQLRKENKEGTAFNLVGCQTKMTIAAQKKVFRMIPGLENVNFLRFGSIHRNTYVNSPGKLDERFSFMGDKGLYFAGQLTGVEGYIESAASGIIAGIMLASEIKGAELPVFPPETAMGGLSRHVAGRFEAKEYCPTNFNFGLLPRLEGKKIRNKKEKKGIMAERGFKEINGFIENYPFLKGE